MKKYVMGHTKHGTKCHIVDSEDLAVGLCGVKITHLVRRYDSQELVLFSDVWMNSQSDTRNCFWCEDRL